MTASPCVAHCSRIHRYVEPRDWPAALAEVPDECRPFVEDYLRGIAARMRVKRAIASSQLPKEFKR